MKNNLVRLSETKNLRNLTVLVTSKCNLKCKHCATYASCHPNPVHYDLEVLKESLSRYYESMSIPGGLITISGGEPLLHPKLPEFIEFVKKYEDRVRMIEIITNGSVIPNDRLIESLKGSNKINLLIDNYGENLSVNLSKITSKLDNNDIPYRVRNYTSTDTWCDGWIDVSDFSEKKRTETEIKDIFSRCAFNNIYKNIDFLINGKVHMCYVIKEALPMIEESDDESVNLLDYSLTPHQIEEKIYELRNRSCLKGCTNCNGYLIEDGVRRLPAEQM